MKKDFIDQSEHSMHRINQNVKQNHAREYHAGKRAHELIGWRALNGFFMNKSELKKWRNKSKQNYL